MREPNQRYKRTELSQAQQRFIKRHEERLGKKCTLIWEFTNPQGQKYIFARIGLKRDTDNLVVTVAYFNKALNRFIVMGE